MGIAGLVNKPTTPINDQSGYPTIAWDNFFTGLASGLISYTYQTPTTGFSFQIPNGVDAVVLNPSGTLATGTLILPKSASDGQVLSLITTQTITSLTLAVALGSGQSIINSITTLTPAGAQYFFVLQKGSNSVISWVRKQ